MRDTQRSPRVLRGIVGIALLGLVLLLVMRYVGDYRAANGTDSPEVPSAEETATPTLEETEAPPANGENGSDEGTTTEGAGVVVVVIDGLNFRSQPDAGASVIRGLGSGERLTLLETVNGWHRVRDSRGAEGFVSSNPQYTRVE